MGLIEANGKISQKVAINAWAFKALRPPEASEKTRGNRVPSKKVSRVPRAPRFCRLEDE